MASQYSFVQRFNTSAFAGSGSTPAMTCEKLTSRYAQAVSVCPTPMDRAVDRVQVHRGVHGRQQLGEMGMGFNRAVGHRPDEVATPIPLQPFGIQAIKGGLQRGEGGRTDTIEGRLHLPDRRENLIGPCRIARVAPDHRTRLMHVEGFRERCHRWDGHACEEPVEILVLSREEIPVPPEDVGGGR